MKTAFKMHKNWAVQEVLRIWFLKNMKWGKKSGRERYGIISLS